MAETPGRSGQDDEGDEELSPLARAMRAAEPYVSAVWRMVGGPVVGVLAGYFLDKKLGTGPWMLVGLSVLGIVVGFYAFVSTMLKMGKKR